MDPLRISLDKTGNDLVEFAPSGLRYRGQVIEYRDVSSITAFAVGRYVNAIPCRSDYSFVVKSEFASITVRFASLLAIGDSRKQSIWGELLDAASHFIFPPLLERLSSAIMKKFATVTIGHVALSKGGISASRWLRSPLQVSWADFAGTAIASGEVMLARKIADGGKSTFTRVALRQENAIIMPPLTNRLYQIMSDEAKRQKSLDDLRASPLAQRMDVDLAVSKLSSPSKSDRLSSVEVIGKLGRSASCLIDLVSELMWGDSSQQVRDAAAQTLPRLLWGSPDEAVAELERVVQTLRRDRSVETLRVGVAMWGAMAHLAPIKDCIRALLQDGDPRICVFAREVIRASHYLTPAPATEA